MHTLSFDVSGMTCGGCTGSVQRALSKLDGVSHVEVGLHPGLATVTTDPARVTSVQIESAISALGYPASSNRNGSAPKKWARCSVSRKYTATALNTSRPMAYLERQNGGALSASRC